MPQAGPRSPQPVVLPEGSPAAALACLSTCHCSPLPLYVCFSCWWWCSPLLYC